MGNKKKQYTQGTFSRNQQSDTPDESADPEVTTVETGNQINHLVEVKEEPQIKGEPESIGEVADVPISNYHDLEYPIGVNQSNGEYDFESLDCDDVKNEVKDEVDKKKEDLSKTNADSDEVAMENRSDDQLPSPPQAQDEDDFISLDSGHDVGNTRSFENVDDSINSVKKHKCQSCEYSTDYKSNLNKHLLKHTGEKPHGCDFCPKRFKAKQSLLGHMKVHVKEFLFHCSTCLQGFSENDKKKAHEVNCKVHRYECHLCKKLFGSMKARMMDHMLVHSGNRPFECKECFKQFTRKDNLNKHIELHAGPRTFRCSNCRMGFSQQEVRNTHEEKCNRPVFECDICGKSFVSNSHLIRHMRTHSGETPFECQCCSKQFKWECNLNNHMKSHTKKLPFKCLICCLGFLNDNKRKAHQRNCHRLCYECYLCKKHFNTNQTDLKAHMNSHSGERPFQCELCSNTFTRNSALKQHTKRIHDKNN